MKGRQASLPLVAGQSVSRRGEPAGERAASEFALVAGQSVSRRASPPVKGRQALITYHFATDEKSKGPVVSEEWLRWRRGRQYGRPFRFLSYRHGKGEAISGEEPDEQGQRRILGREIAAVTIGDGAGRVPDAAGSGEFGTSGEPSHRRGIGRRSRSQVPISLIAYYTWVPGGSPAWKPGFRWPDDPFADL